jgi:CheY-like chemotaxis protein
MSGPLRVLLVEDEVINAMGLALELRNAGIDVYRTVTTGEAAVEEVVASPPDVVLLDIRLAGLIDGMETARRIRAAGPVPIIFMTGYPDRDLVDQARAIDALGYLIKPIAMPELFSLLDRVRRRS